MPKRDRAEYMRRYRTSRKHAALESPDADWRRLHPTAALVELARALPDDAQDDGTGILPPRPGTIAAPDAHWRTLAPSGAFFWLTATIAATIGPDGTA